jgi:hypothetical protein
MTIKVLNDTVLVCPDQHIWISPTDNSTIEGIVVERGPKVLFDFTVESRVWFVKGNAISLLYNHKIHYIVPSSCILAYENK